MGLSPDNTSSLYVMATRHKEVDGVRLYTNDLSEIRDAAKRLDVKYSAIGEREVASLTKDQEGQQNDLELVR